MRNGTILAIDRGTFDLKKMSVDIPTRGGWLTLEDEIRIDQLRVTRDNKKDGGVT